MSRCRVLLLSHRDQERLPPNNLGDTAHMAGLRRLLTEQFGLEVDSASWKSFSHFTSRDLPERAGSEQIAAEFARRSRRILARGGKPSRVQQLLSTSINSRWLLGSPPGQWLEAQAQRATGITVLGYFLPRLLRSEYARRFVGQVQKSEAVVFNGGGLCADHLTRYLPAHLLEIDVALQLGKPVYFVNYTYDLSDADAIEMFRRVAAQARLHILREPGSCSRLASLGIPAERIVASVDAAFFADLPALAGAADVARSEGIQPGSIAVTLRGDRAAPVSQHVALVQALQQFQRPLWFVDTCRTQDEKIYRAICRRHDIRRLSKQYDHATLVQLLRSFDAVVSDRYHMAVFCMQAGCPIVPLRSSTAKTKGLFSLFDYPLPILDSTADHQAICGHVAQALAHRDAWGQHLAEQASTFRERLVTDYAHLVESIKQSERLPSAC